VLQIMAQLLRFNPGGITKPFQDIFPVILHPDMYTFRGNCPALVELLKAYLVTKGQGASSAASVVVPKLTAVLGVWQKLCKSKSTETHAMRMLETLVCHLPVSAYGNFLKKIFEVLITKLMKAKGDRFKFQFVPTFCVLAGKIGGNLLVQTIEGLNVTMFTNLIMQVVIPHLPKVAGSEDRKKCAVGLARLISTTDQWSQPRLQPTLKALVEAVIAFVKSAGTSSSTANVDQTLGIAEIEYNSMSSFSRLSYTKGSKVDPFQEVPQVGPFLKQQIQQFNSKCPGILAQLGLAPLLQGL